MHTLLQRVYLHVRAICTGTLQTQIPAFSPFLPAKAAGIKKFKITSKINCWCSKEARQFMQTLDYLSTKLAVGAAPRFMMSRPHIDK